MVIYQRIHFLETNPRRIKQNSECKNIYNSVFSGGLVIPHVNIDGTSSEHRVTDDDRAGATENSLSTPACRHGPCVPLRPEVTESPRGH